MGSKYLQIPSELAELYAKLSEGQFVYAVDQLTALGREYSELDLPERLSLIRIIGREAARVVPPFSIESDRGEVVTLHDG
jgi:hypothetical protein